MKRYPSDPEMPKSSQAHWNHKRYFKIFDVQEYSLCTEQQEKPQKITWKKIIQNLVNKAIWKTPYPTSYIPKALLTHFNSSQYWKGTSYFINNNTLK